MGPCLPIVLLVVVLGVVTGCSRSPSTPEDIPQADTPVRVTEETPASSPRGDEAYEERRREYLEVKDEVDAALEDLRSAEGDEERAAARARLEDAQEKEKEYAWGTDPRHEPVTWDEALTWWPYRPVLQAEWLPDDELQERLFAVSAQVGRHGDPRSEIAGLALVYESTAAPTATSQFQDVVGGGGLFVLVTYFPPGQNTDTGFQANPPPTIVTVRGHPASMTERTETNHGVDRRDVKWQQPVNGGGTLQWNVMNGTALYTVEETVEFIDRMRER